MLLEVLIAIKFWNEILGQVVVGIFQPRNMDIQHPTLRLMHQWIAMTLFSRQDHASVDRHDFVF